MTLSLAVQAIIAGRLARGIGMTALADLPPSWNAQHAALLAKGEEACTSSSILAAAAFSCR